MERKTWQRLQDDWYTQGARHSTEGMGGGRYNRVGRVWQKRKAGERRGGRKEEQEGSQQGPTTVPFPSPLTHTSHELAFGKSGPNVTQKNKQTNIPAAAAAA